MKYSTTASMTKFGFVLSVLSALIFTGCNNKQEFVNPPQEQHFNQKLSYNNKIDLILLADNSSSMNKYQVKLSEQMPGLIEKLDAIGMDYHIGIITTDMDAGGNGGKLVGNGPKFLTNQTPHLIDELKARILTGEAGSIWESGLDSLSRVLSKDYQEHEGAGFLRDDALLAVIFLTNEDDYSKTSPQDSIAQLDALKKPFPSGARSWIANFIGITSLSNNCKTPGQYEEVGVRYLELVKYTQGISESICNGSFSKAVSNVQVRITEILSDFYLQKLPDLASIKVYVNEKEVPQNAVDGWTYEKSGNFIRFHGTALPGVYDKIKVDFSPATAG